MKSLILVLAAFVTLCACGGNSSIRPVSELKTLPAKKIFEFGAERYTASDYNNAVYYYSNIIALYPEDIDYQAMATYEIGFIYFRQKRYQEALDQFNKVENIKTSSTAPLILANQMIRKIEALSPQK
jgi:outer membrane protein assembly factor BamD (BamD/ComL family)